MRLLDELAPGGQDWGFPPPSREAHRNNGLVKLFAQSICKNARHGGALRIDHVMRFFRLFLIPDQLTAAQGAYVERLRRGSPWHSCAEECTRRIHRHRRGFGDGGMVGAFEAGGRRHLGIPKASVVREESGRQFSPSAGISGPCGGLDHYSRSAHAGGIRRRARHRSAARRGSGRPGRL